MVRVHPMLLLGLALLLVPAPAPAAPLSVADASGGWVAWVRSDGAYGVSREGEVLPPASEGYATCGGLAPEVNYCELRDYLGFGWRAGWNVPPPLAPTPAGALVASTWMELTGGNGGRVVFACDWAMPTVFDQGRLVVTCRLVEFGYPLGLSVARFHTGAVDPLVLPYVPAGNPPLHANDVEAGVGTWQAVLFAA